MKDDATQYDKRLAEYRDRLLQRNREMTMDDDDYDDIPDEAYGKVPDNTSVKAAGKASDNGYQSYADKVDEVLKEVGVSNKVKPKPSQAPHKSAVSGNQKKNRNRGHLTDIQRWSIAAIILLIAFIILTIAYVSANARYKYNQMDIREIAEEDLVVNDGVKMAVKGYTTIVLYGVDSRDNNLNTGTNSDSIILVSIENDTKKVKLVSIYRDTLVEIQNTAKITNKVNYAYQLGGALMSINTLNANFDLYITDYITVDFNAMADIINALGGVEVDIKEEEINNLNKNLAEQISLSGVYSDGVHNTGVQMLNGQQAVAYSRIRSTGNGDITRTERQRNVLLGLISRAMSADKDVISNLIEVSFDGISTSFTKDDITKLAKNISDYEIEGNTGFPFLYSTISLDEKGNVIASADAATNITALHQYLYGDSNYSPSSEASAISSQLVSETGVTAAEASVPEDSSSVDTSETSSEDDNTSGQSDNTDTITAPPEGMIENE
jgi:LCP family protein required for cell wall assembly